MAASLPCRELGGLRVRGLRVEDLGFRVQGFRRLEANPKPLSLGFLQGLFASLQRPCLVFGSHLGASGFKNLGLMLKEGRFRA